MLSAVTIFGDGYKIAKLASVKHVPI